jgi:hypothetical protein
MLFALSALHIDVVPQFMLHAKAGKQVARVTKRWPFAAPVRMLALAAAEINAVAWPVLLAEAPNALRG